jgi:hypothetical protein
MQKQIVPIALCLLLSACGGYKQIGKMNLMSDRNIDSKLDYKAITTYAGGGEREIKKSRALTLEEALDNTVKRVPGGEFVMNAKIYQAGKYFAVEGDVWGKSTDEKPSYKGYKIGDKVTWKKIGKFREGKIKAFKDSDLCLVENEDGRTVTVLIEKLSKIE